MDLTVVSFGRCGRFPWGNLSFFIDGTREPIRIKQPGAAQDNLTDNTPKRPDIRRECVAGAAPE